MSKQLKTGEFGVLEVVSDNGNGTKLYPLKPGNVEIGKGLLASIQLMEKNVLDTHCVVEVHPNGVATVVARSTYNPTKLNEKVLRKDKYALLKHGDMINIGQTNIFYKNNSLTEQTLLEKGNTFVKPRMFNTPRRGASANFKVTPMAANRTKKMFPTPASKTKLPKRRTSTTASMHSIKIPTFTDTEDESESLPSKKDVGVNAIAKEPAAKSNTPSIRGSIKRSSSFSTKATTINSEETKRLPRFVTRTKLQDARRKSVSDLTAPVFSTQHSKRNQSFMEISNPRQISETAPTFKTPGRKSKYGNPQPTTSTPIARTRTKLSVSEPRNRQRTGRSSSIDTRFINSTSKTKGVEDVAKISSRTSRTRRTSSLCSKHSVSSPKSTATAGIVLDSSINSETSEIYSINTVSSNLDTTGSSSFQYQNCHSGIEEELEPNFDVSGVAILTKTPEKEVRKSRSSIKSTRKSYTMLVEERHNVSLSFDEKGHVRNSKSSIRISQTDSFTAPVKRSITPLMTFSRNFNIDLSDDESVISTDTTSVSEQEDFTERVVLQNSRRSRNKSYSKDYNTTSNDDSVVDISDVNEDEDVITVQVPTSRSSLRSGKKNYSKSYNTSLSNDDTMKDALNISGDEDITTVQVPQSRTSGKKSYSKSYNTTLSNANNMEDALDISGDEDVITVPVRNSRTSVRSGKKSYSKSYNSTLSNADTMKDPLDVSGDEDVTTVQVPHSRSSIRSGKKSYSKSYNTTLSNANNLEDDLDISGDEDVITVQVPNSRTSVRSGKKSYSKSYNTTLSNADTMKDPLDISGDEDVTTVQVPQSRTSIRSGKKSYFKSYNTTLSNANNLEDDLDISGDEDVTAVPRTSIRSGKKSYSRSYNITLPNDDTMEDISDLSGEEDITTEIVQNSRTSVRSGRKSYSKSYNTTLPINNSIEAISDVSSVDLSNAGKEEVQVQKSRTSIRSGRKSYQNNGQEAEAIVNISGVESLTPKGQVQRQNSRTSLRSGKKSNSKSYVTTLPNDNTFDDSSVSSSDQNSGQEAKAVVNISVGRLTPKEKMEGQTSRKSLRSGKKSHSKSYVTTLSNDNTFDDNSGSSSDQNSGQEAEAVVNISGFERLTPKEKMEGQTSRKSLRSGRKSHSKSYVTTLSNDNMFDDNSGSSSDKNSGQEAKPVVNISGLERSTPKEKLEGQTSRKSLRSGRKSHSKSYVTTLSNDDTFDDSSVSASDQNSGQEAKAVVNSSGLERLTPKEKVEGQTSRKSLRSGKKSHSKSHVTTLSNDNTFDDNSVSSSDQNNGQEAKPVLNISGLQSLTPKEKVEGRKSRSSIRGRTSYSVAVLSPLKSTSIYHNETVSEDEKGRNASKNRNVVIRSKSISGLQNLTKTPQNTVQMRKCRSSVKSGMKSYPGPTEKKMTPLMTYSKSFGLNLSDDDIMDNASDVSGSEKCTPKQTVFERNLESPSTSVRSGKKRYSAVPPSPLSIFSKTVNDDASFNDGPDDSQISAKANFDNSPIIAHSRSITGIENLPRTPKNTTQIRVSRSVGKSNRKSYLAQKKSMASLKDDSFGANVDDYNQTENSVMNSPQLTKTPRSASIGSKQKRTPKPTKSPENDLTDVRGVKKLMKTPKTVNSPKNDLRNLPPIKYLYQTTKSPTNSLTDVRGVKRLLTTPAKQNSPKNDLGDVRGVKKIMKTPKVMNQPKNDLTNIPEFKQLFQPHKTPKSPVNSLTDVRGVKRLLATPAKQNSPKNDLGDVRGVKKIMKTPKLVNPPKNDLTNIPEFKQLFQPQKSPKNDLSDLKGLKQILKTPKVKSSPRNDLSSPAQFKKLIEKRKSGGLDHVEGIQELMATPAARKRGRPSKSNPKPENVISEADRLADLSAKRKRERVSKSDYTDVGGVKRMFAEEEAALKNNPNVSGVSELFTSVFGKKPLRTYQGKSPSPNKSDRLGIDNIDSSLDGASVSSDVVNWVNTVNQELETNSKLSPNKQLVNTPVAVLKSANGIAARTPTPNKSNRQGRKENSVLAQSNIVEQSPKQLHPVAVVALKRSKRIASRSPSVLTIEGKLHTSTPNEEIGKSKKIKTGILKDTVNLNKSVSPKRGRPKKDTTKENLTPDQSDTASDAQQKKVKFQIEETRRSQRTPRTPSKLEAFISELPSRNLSKELMNKAEKQVEEVVKQKTRKRGAKHLEENEQPVVKKNRINNEEVKARPTRARNTKANEENIAEAVTDVDSEASVEMVKRRPKRAQKLDSIDDQDIILIKPHQRKVQVTDTTEKLIDDSDEKVKTRPKRTQKQNEPESKDLNEIVLPKRRRQVQTTETEVNDETDKTRPKRTLKQNESDAEDLVEAVLPKRRQRNAKVTEKEQEVSDEKVQSVPKKTQKQKQEDNDAKVKTRPKRAQKQNESDAEDLDEAVSPKRYQKQAKVTKKKQEVNDEKVKSHPNRAQKQNESEVEDLDEVAPPKRRQRNAKATETVAEVNIENVKTLPKRGQKQSESDAEDLDEAVSPKRHQKHAKVTKKEQEVNDEKVKSHPNRAQKQNESEVEDLDEVAPPKRRQRNAKATETVAEVNIENVKTLPKRGQKQSESDAEDLDEAVSPKRHQKHAKVTKKEQEVNDEKVKSHPNRAQKQNESEVEDLDEVAPPKRRQRNAKATETVAEVNIENVKTLPKRGQKQSESDAEDLDEAVSPKRHQKQAKVTKKKQEGSDAKVKSHPKRAQKQNESDHEDLDEVVPPKRRQRNAKATEIVETVAEVNIEKVKTLPKRGQKQKRNTSDNEESELPVKKRGKQIQVNKEPESESDDSVITNERVNPPIKAPKPKKGESSQLSRKPARNSRPENSIINISEEKPKLKRGRPRKQVDVEETIEDVSLTMPLKTTTHKGAAGKQGEPQQKSKGTKKEIVKQPVPIRKSTRTRK